MAVFLAAFVPLLRGGYVIATRAGFHLFVGSYAAQRFRLGVPQALRHRGRPVEPLPPDLPRAAWAIAWSYGGAALRDV